MFLPFGVLPFWDGKKRDSLPIMTFAIMAANVFFFILELATSVKGAQLSFGVLPDRILHQLFSGELSLMLGAVATMITAMFLHAGWMHLIGNMVTLFAFGPMLEERLGENMFVAFYLLSGFLGTLAYVILGSGSATIAVGASVALFGLMGAYMVLCPRIQMWSAIMINGFPLPLPLPFKLPALWLIGAVMLVQFFNVIAGGNINAGGVAGYEHFGGFVAGFALAHLALRYGWLQPPTDAVPPAAPQPPAN